MDKRDFFIRCMQEGKYRIKPWVMRAFALVRETKTVEQIQFLDILQTPAGFFFKDPDGSLESITGKDMVAGKPIFHPKEKLIVKKGEIPGIDEDTETDYGRVLWHCMIFVYSFGTKTPFVNKARNMRQFEGELASKLDDDVLIPNQEGGEAKYVDDPKKFYPRELVRYYEAMAYARGMAMYFVPAASPKSMSIDPAVLKRRDELFNDPKIDLTNQAVAAKVEAELTAMDQATFKDDPASGYLISKKNWMSRKKCFISFGSGAGLTPDSQTPYVKNSLRDGTDVTQFKAYNDEMRSGSYKRGVETMFGGELDKWLVRESSNVRVTEDCGTTVGIPDTVTQFNQLQMLGKYIVNGKDALMLNAENIGTYMGKKILRRSPAACRSPAPDYCKVCLGDKLSMNPDAISIAFSQYGHAFMGESMSAMHGKALTIARMDFLSEVS